MSASLSRRQNLATFMSYSTPPLERAIRVLIFQVSTVTGVQVTRDGCTDRHPDGRPD